jgi:CHAT domain-containing protein/Tfp pilus assembly protein PilF
MAPSCVSIARFSLIFLLLLGPTRMSAQESLWKQLDAKASKLQNEGHYKEALPIAIQALAAAQKAFAADDTRIATALGNLATVHQSLFTFDKAEQLYKQALAIDEKKLAPDSADLASDLNNLASLYVQQGRYAEAEPLFHRGLAIDEKALGQENPDLATDLNNLALLCVRQGKFAEAEPLYQRALKIDEKALKPGDPALATDLNNLATLYADQDDIARAEPLYERALAIDEKALGPNHPKLAVDFINVASLAQDTDHDAEAEKLYKGAIAIQQKALGPDNPDLGVMINDLASLYEKRGNYDQAEIQAKEALRIDEASLDADHPQVGTALMNLAIIEVDRNDEQGAQPRFQRAFENMFQQFQYNFGAMSEVERLTFLGRLYDRFPVYFSFVHRFRQQDPALIGSMYNLLLWEKGFVAGSVADLRRRVQSSGDKDALQLLAELTAKRSQIAALLNTKPANRSEWLAQIIQLRSQANDIERALIARSAPFAERKKLDRATWQQVRDALKPGEAAVEFAYFQLYDKKWSDTGNYVALVVTPETRDEPQYIVLGDDKQLEGAAITSFEHAVQTRGLQAEEGATLPGADAYALIFAPLEKVLESTKRVYASPDGILNQLPLGIIPTPDGKLVMERYDLRLLSSTKDILRAAPSSSAKYALLIGDPLFDLTDTAQSAAMQKLGLRSPAPSVLPAASAAREADDSSTLPPLPGTGIEVNTIANLMQQNGWTAQTYTHELALKGIVEQSSNMRVVHIATHGFFLPDPKIDSNGPALGHDMIAQGEEPMLRSGLYFAGADRALAGQPPPTGLDNGVLTALEAGNLNLAGTELVVLSACDTGQGRVKNGEGVFGLRRALEEAGAQSILMSLWSVPDKETLELMQAFYTRWLSGTEKHEALRQAQLAIREEVKQAHDGKDVPYYWGAFVLVGR